MNGSNNLAVVKDTTLDDADIQLLDRFDAILKAQNKSNNKAAEEMEINPSAITGFRKGNYAGKIEAVRTKILKWVEHNERKSEASALLPSAPTFFHGPVAQDILATLAMAHMTTDLAVIYGGPGVGKSIACEHYREQNTAVWIATMRHHCKTEIQMLQAIARAVGAAPKPHAGADILFGAIQDRIQGTNGLLIIDEANHLPIPCLDELRCLYDETKTAIALVGDQSINDKTKPSKQVPPQLSRRIGIRTRIDGAGDGDIAAFLEAWNITDPDVSSQLTQISQKPGALGQVTKVVNLAVILAGGVSNITPAHTKDAWRRLGGMK